MATVVTARCVDGPMHGLTHQAKGVKGPVVVDKANGLVDVYDWNGTVFTHQRTDKRDVEKEAKAVADPERDVVAFDPERMHR